MAGFSQFLDFNHGGVTRKQKKQRDYETYRNSFELPSNDFQGYYAHAYSYDETPDVSARKSFSRSSDASMTKSLIDVEKNKKTKGMQNAPNIVARLMGMDTLTSDLGSVVQPLDKNVEEVHLEKESAEPVFKGCKASGEELHWDHEYAEIYSDKWCKGTDSKIYGRRVHPQEKELQEFKKEFEAWQSARFLECARVIQLGSVPEQWLARLDLAKEKMTHCDKSRKSSTKSMNYLHGNISESTSLSRGNFRYNGCTKEGGTGQRRQQPVALGSHVAACWDGKISTTPLQEKGLDPRETYASRIKGVEGNFEHLFRMECNREPDECDAPTRIVILKPDTDSFGSVDESCVSSSGSMEDRDSIVDILEGVKDRLLKKSPAVRGGRIGTPFKEKLSNLKRTPRCVAEQIVESLNREYGANLQPLESMKLYSSEVHALDPGSPEFVSRDTRTLLSESSSNTLYRENLQDTPNVSHSSPRQPVFDNVRERLEEARDILSAQNDRSFWNDTYYETVTHTRSFRHQLSKWQELLEKPSPRKLMRSLSAPLSGASLAKLLLEDRHVASGDRIREKHQVHENMAADSKSRKKERFNFREKVSNIRYTLKGKLFTRKLQLNHARRVDQLGLVNGIINDEQAGAIPDYGDRHDNFTEVPPTPASVYSGAQEEFWKVADNPSPLSVSDVFTSPEDQNAIHVLRDISSNLTELQKQLNQLDYGGSDAIMTTVLEEPLEADFVDLGDEAKSYVRYLLVASGLFHGITDKCFMRWDSFSKPISTWIFEQVEASSKLGNNAGPAADQNDKSLQHRLLFDLLNEVLTTILHPCTAPSRFTTKVTVSTMIRLPKGKMLLEKAWNIIDGHLHPSTDEAFYSVEDVVAHDLCSAPWSSHLDQDVVIVGRDFECQIISDLIEEMMIDLL